ncbi:MAG: O-antigen ligase family protein, partial [Actinomycetota bacterium]|nr:O-antigen ligase family protein [Actinomycetota bacterium]
MTHPEATRSSGRPGLLAVTGGTLLALAVGAAVAAPGSTGRQGALALMLVPLGVSAVVGLPLATFAVALLTACQVGAWRVPIAGFHFLPEHFVVAGFVAALLVRHRHTVIRSPAAYEVLLLAWVLWSALTSIAYSVDRARSLGVVGWQLLAWLILWGIRSWFLSEPTQGRKALQAGMAAAAVVGFGAFVLWLAALGGLFRVGVQHDFVTGTVAARGLSYEANLFASLELCWLFLALRWRVVNDARTPEWQLAGLVLGIVSSMTRAAWIAAILIIAVTFFAIHDQRRRAEHAGSGVRRRRRASRPLKWIVGAVLLVLLVAPAGRKFQAVFDFGSSTGAERVKTWKVAADDLTASRGWVLGRGTNSFGQRHLSRTVAGQPDYLGNLALTVLYDTGIVGLILFGGTMVAFVLHRHLGWGRYFKLLFVTALLIVGAAASPIWFGYVWVTIAAIDTEWQHEHFEEGALNPVPDSERLGPRDA